jgi:hypothetical protein
MSGQRFEQCEWNPSTGWPAHVGDPRHALAVYGVGKFHLCASCAGLKRWSRFKKRLLPGAVEPVPTPTTAAQS